METRTKNSRGFVIAALVFLVLGLIVEFNTQLSQTKEQRLEAATLEKTLARIAADDVPHLLSKGSTPKVLYVFASWCGACHEITPYMLKAMQADAGKKDYVFISMDQKPQALALYLAKEKLTATLHPYILTPASPTALAQALAPLKGRFDGGIPYIAEFKNGILTFDNVGIGNEAMVNHLLRNKAP